MPQLRPPSRSTVQAAKGAASHFAHAGRKAAQREEQFSGFVDAAGDVTQVMGSMSAPASSNPVMQAVQMVDMSSNLGLFAFDMGAPLAIGAIGGTGKVARWTGGKLGAENLGSSLIGVQEGYKAKVVERTLADTKLGTAYAGLVDTISKPITGLIAGVDKMTGLVSWRANKHLGSAVSHGQQAAAHASGVLGQLPKEAQGHVEELLLAAGTQNVGAFDHHSKAITEMMGDLEIALHKPLKGIQKAADKQMQALGSASTVASLATGTHNTLERVKAATVQSAISKSLWATGSVTSSALAVRDTMSDMDAFRSLVADIKGVEKEAVTSGDVLFGELPQAGNVARKALLTAAAPRAILQAVNQTFNVRMLMGKHVNFLFALGLPMLGDQAVEMFNKGNILDVYKEMKSNEVAGQPNDAEHYAELIGAAHKELHVREGANSSFAQEVGRIYAEKQASVKETLADAQNGKISQLLEHIKAQNVGGQDLSDGTDHAHPLAGPVQSETQAEVPSPMVGQVQTIAANSNVPGQTLNASATPTSFADRVGQAEPTTQAAQVTR